jgi:DNA-3-methyladenine glycosylase II
VRPDGQFELALPGPLDFAASLEIFRRSGDDMIDRWDGAWLVRTTRVDGRPSAYASRVDGTVENPILQVIVENPADREAIEQALTMAFPPLVAEFKHLCHVDPLIGSLAKLHRGFRPVLQSDLLSALVRCISAQQVNLKWASTTRRRLAATFGRLHRINERFVYSLDADRLAALEIADIRALQFTTRKAEYIINLARAIANGELTIEALTALPDEEVISRIIAIRGLGLWTAEWVLARTLGRPRVSAGDLGVRKAVATAYFGGRMPSPNEVREATSHWGLAAALAQGLLLHAQHEKTLETAVAKRAQRRRTVRAPLKKTLTRGAIRARL